MPRLLLRVAHFFRQPRRHARLLARMDELLAMINQAAEETRQVCDRFLAEAAASRSESGRPL
ncbi:hypothetical protein Pla175_13070 [Pirellulimonas nuda]|uniref:Uncharacterized protein n=1 Tax=Pirellulimonas nuda TaxID=2528009 RepID=A0A518D912_9BACT|nr:hypothetical protein [Pirellulimonas nuda]QDU87940.1 hypothetical protein Pla175_13070 [Pirellulimonas nuda]